MKKGFVVIGTSILSLTILAGGVRAYLSNDAPHDFDPSEHEIVSEPVGELKSGETDVPCGCGAEVVLVKTGESGFAKNHHALCRHGLNGNVHSNLIVYVNVCTKCGTATPFTTKIEEVRCNH